MDATEAGGVAGVCLVLALGDWRLLLLLGVALVLVLTIACCGSSDDFGNFVE